MKAVVQRVSRACVSVDGRTIGQIDAGLLVLLGVAAGDTDTDVRYMVDKLKGLRIFADTQGKMNRSLVDFGGAILVVSQFTLLSDTRKGRRPGFEAAAAPDHARALYEQVIAALQRDGVQVATGQFGAYMKVSLENDGPVTFVIDSRD